MAKKKTSASKSFRLHNEQSHPREEAAKQVVALGFFVMAVAALVVAVILVK